MEQRFLGKTVLITGAAGDIGSAALQRFAAEGADVIGVDLHIDALEKAIAQLPSHPGEVTARQLDISQESAVRRCFNELTESFGKIDILFNNAGVEGDCADITEFDTASFDQVMAVNVRGVFLGMKYAVSIMQQQGGGAIVNTASVAGLTGAPGFAAYCASKHAVIGLTRSVAKQQGVNNIRVNAVCPSATKGKMMTAIEEKTRQATDLDIQDAVVASIPMGRYAEVEDIVSMVAYLSSDEAKFLTGGVYTVDGGLTA